MENLGNIVIAPEVIKSIVVETIKDIPEVCSVVTTDSSNTFYNIFKTNETQKLEVEMGETECDIDISISVLYGAKIREVAQKVQELVVEKVEDLSGIKVREINVTVVKVEKKEEEQPEIIEGENE